MFKMEQMNILEIPFVKKVGIEKKASNELSLSFNEGIKNHLDTIHASAQFALAETASGEMLLETFPLLVGKVIPVLRESKVKFKKPAINSISAKSTITAESSEKFNKQFKAKGRGSVPVEVEIKDSDGNITCIGTFFWYIQRLEQVNQ